jgi:hypothetical protein
MKAHCRVHKSPSPVYILNQMNTIHTLHPYSRKIYFNIILHLRLGLPSGSSPQAPQLKFRAHFSSLHARYVTRSPDPLWFDQPEVFGEEYLHIIEFLIMKSHHPSWAQIFS